MSSSRTPAKKDYFFYDREELEKIASAEIVGFGLACFQENRVLGVDSDGVNLWASVEDGEGENLPLSVRIGKDSEDTLSTSCNCGSVECICRHAVAALFAGRCGSGKSRRPGGFEQAFG